MMGGKVSKNLAIPEGTCCYLSHLDKKGFPVYDCHLYVIPSFTSDFERTPNKGELWKHRSREHFVTIGDIYNFIKPDFTIGWVVMFSGWMMEKNQFMKMFEVYEQLCETCHGKGEITWTTSAFLEENRRVEPCPSDCRNGRVYSDESQQKEEMKAVSDEEASSEEDQEDFLRRGGNSNGQ
jgi:hypothetical protein